MVMQYTNIKTGKIQNLKMKSEQGQNKNIKT